MSWSFSVDKIHWQSDLRFNRRSHAGIFDSSHAYQHFRMLGSTDVRKYPIHNIHIITSAIKLFERIWNHAV